MKPSLSESDLFVCVSLCVCAHTYVHSVFGREGEKNLGVQLSLTFAPSKESGSLGRSLAFSSRWDQAPFTGKELLNKTWKCLMFWMTKPLLWFFLIFYSFIVCFCFVLPDAFGCGVKRKELRFWLDLILTQAGFVFWLSTRGWYGLIFSFCDHVTKWCCHLQIEANCFCFSVCPCIHLVLILHNRHSSPWLVQ